MQMLIIKEEFEKKAALVRNHCIQVPMSTLTQIHGGLSAAMRAIAKLRDSILWDCGQLLLGYSSLRRR